MIILYYLCIDKIGEEFQKTNDLYLHLLNNTIKISSLKNTAGKVLDTMQTTQKIMKENHDWLSPLFRSLSQTKHSSTSNSFIKDEY